ncbi:MAG TPA: OmpA family protein [Gemmatimonadales bacterium]
MKPSKCLPVLVMLATVLGVSVAAAQIPSSIKRKVKERVERAKDQAADRALDAIEGAVKCVVTDQSCIDNAEKAGKPVVVTDAQGQPLPAEQQPPGSQPPGTGAWANYDFKPGERILYAEDFTKDEVGDFPRRMEFKSGALEIVDWNGQRFLRATEDSRFFVVVPEPLPERFTMEFDYAIPSGGVWIFIGDDESTRLEFHSSQGGVRLWNTKTQVDASGRYSSEQSPSKVRRARVLVDGRYVKVYLDDKRLLNVPNADLGRANKIQFYTDGRVDNPSLFGNFRVAAGGKKLYDALTEKGRVATQGIFFATGSDVLRPESTPVLKEIVAMLQEHAELKLLIEGHTDNAGDDAANLALSDKRAAAVMRYLVERAGVDASRLDARGLGESKSVASNDTPEGRQQNRRVELVRR